MIARRQAWLLAVCLLLAAWSLAWWPVSPGWALWGAFYWLIGWWALVLALQVGLSQRANRAAARAAPVAVQGADMGLAPGAQGQAAIGAQGQAATVAAQHEPAPLQPVGVLGAVRVWLWACWVAPQVFFWRQPFRESRWPDQLPAPRGTSPEPIQPEPIQPESAQPELVHPESTPPQVAHPSPRAVLFVHGFAANRAFWHPWLSQLTVQGQPFVAHTIAKPFALLDEQAAELTPVVDRIVQATGQPPLIVAHSMGGLVVRAWLRQEAQQGHDWRARVHRVAVLAVPVGGTGLARWGYTALSHQMRRAEDGGVWVPQLNADLDALGVPRALFACWASNSDNMVFPAHAALLAGAEQHVRHAVPHVPLAFAPEVMTAVLALR